MGKVSVRNRNLNKFDKNGKPKQANWEYRFEAAKIDGKRRSISKSGFRTKKEAEIEGTKAMAAYNSVGSTFEPSEISFADYLDYWFDSYVLHNCKYNTQLDYRIIIDNHLKQPLGQYKLKSLTAMKLQEFVNVKYASGLKKSTLKNIMAVLTSSLKYAVVPSGFIQASPAAYLIFPKLPAAKATAERTTISIEDFNKILERFPKGNSFRYAMLISFYTGLRIGEVFGLTWQDIDFQEATINVNRLIYKRKNAWFIGTTKTESSERIVSVGGTLIQELKDYYTLQKKNELEYGEFYFLQYMKESGKDEKGEPLIEIVELQKSIPVEYEKIDLIFRKPDGELLTTESFKYAARVIHHELGLKDFCFHSLRHTHATALIESGVNPKTVQKRLGHAKIETTLNTYCHDTEKMKEKAVDVFEKYAKLVDKNA